LSRRKGGCRGEKKGIDCRGTKREKAGGKDREVETQKSHREEEHTSFAVLRGIAGKRSRGGGKKKVWKTKRSKNGF